MRIVSSERRRRRLTGEHRSERSQPLDRTSVASEAIKRCILVRPKREPGS
jgi:hypothetical protein